MMHVAALSLCIYLACAATASLILSTSVIWKHFTITMLWEFCPLMTSLRISSTVKMATFYVKHPTRIGVRASDRVKILAFGLMFLPEGLAPFRECFGAHVTSVTSFGMVTGITPNEVCYCNLPEEMGFLSFDVAVILDMIKVDHWEASNDTDKKEP